MNDSNHHEAAWECDRFLLGELSAAEEEAFLAQLGRDQFTRELLAEEALLLSMVSDCRESDFLPPPVSLPASRCNGRLRASAGIWWASGALAASLLLIAALAQPQWPGVTANDNGSLAHSHAAPDPLEELASYWSETRWLYDPALAELETELEPRPREGGEEEIAPDWMFAAVYAAEAGEAGESEGTPQEVAPWQ